MLPLVSILFPCYNAAEYLAHSLESLIDQEYRNIEIICINDGSTDNTLEILKRYQLKDPRIVIVDNPQNLGLIGSLNTSFAHIKGEYFARMDADDFSPPDRIARQVDFILKNNQYDIISSAYNYFRENGSLLEYVAPVGTLQHSLKFISLFSTPLAHGSVLGKTSLIKSGIYYYDKNFKHAEDFELFSRLLWQNVPVTNMKQSLYLARLNKGSVSAVYNNAQIRTNQNIIWRNLREYLGIKENISDVNLKVLSARVDTEVSIRELKEGHALLDKFYAIAKTRITFTKQEKLEIRDYLNLQKLNSIVQANKILFQISLLRSIPFLLRSLFLLKFRQVPLLAKKFGKLFSYQK
jgi:glycosyltransferase involved in cell wall biosynthesis